MDEIYSKMRMVGLTPHPAAMDPEKFTAEEIERLSQIVKEARRKARE